jgi:hypothetical protein
LHRVVGQSGYTPISPTSGYIDVPPIPFSKIYNTANTNFRYAT